jgi:hypothetical protein
VIAPIDASVEEAVLDVLQRTGPCGLDDLVVQLPNFTWSRVFTAVDRMSRNGRVLLDCHACSIYSVTLPSQQSSPHSISRQQESPP